MTLKKHNFKYKGKTGIAETPAFKKKKLADFSCNIGNNCKFRCAYCYANSVTLKQKYIQEVLKNGYSMDDFSLYRERNSVLDCVSKDLNKIDSGDNRIVIFCTTCDPCPTPYDTETTKETISLIMTNSDLQVRIFSKSTLLVDLALSLEEYKDRIVYGFSTGTIRNDISVCIEEFASPVQERLEALKYLQQRDYRTFGMLSPILPSEMKYVDELIDTVNPIACEHIWAEAINYRGESLPSTRDKLIGSGFQNEAEEINQLIGNTSNWREYCIKLFIKIRNKLISLNQLDKFRFLQYPEKSKDFADFFCQHEDEGAVYLD